MATRIKFVKKKDRKLVRLIDPPGTFKVGRDAHTDVSRTMGCGIIELKNIRNPWTVRYDEYYYCLTGQLTIRAGRKAYRLSPGDSIWIPKGTSLVNEATRKTTAVYAIFPANWREIEAKKKA